MKQKRKKKCFVLSILLLLSCFLFINPGLKADTIQLPYSLTAQQISDSWTRYGSISDGETIRGGASINSNYDRLWNCMASEHYNFKEDSIVIKITGDEVYFLYTNKKQEWVYVDIQHNQSITIPTSPNMSFRIGPYKYNYLYGLAIKHLPYKLPRTFTAEEITDSWKKNGSINTGSQICGNVTIDETNNAFDNSVEYQFENLEATLLGIEINEENSNGKGSIYYNTPDSSWCKTSFDENTNKVYIPSHENLKIRVNLDKNRCASSLTFTDETPNVTVYKNGERLTYNIAELTTNFLVFTDSIKVSGNLEQKDLQLFSNSLRDPLIPTNLSLRKVDLKKAHLTTINSLNGLFASCKRLQTVIFSDEINSQPVSADSIFYNTYLKTLENFDKFQNITSLKSGFENCLPIKHIQFSTVANNNAVSFYKTFAGNRDLTTIDNLQSFKNINSLESTFQNCKALASVNIALTTATLENININNTFSGTNSSCIKYLPSTETTIPTSWKTANYTNFILPLQVANISKPSTIMEGETLELVTPTINYDYCFRKDTLWQLSADTAFSDPITIDENTAISAAMKNYYIRCAAVSFNADVPGQEKFYYSNTEQITVDEYLKISPIVAPSATYHGDILNIPTPTMIYSSKEQIEQQQWEIKENDNWQDFNIQEPIHYADNKKQIRYKVVTNLNTYYSNTLTLNINKRLLQHNIVVDTVMTYNGGTTANFSGSLTNVLPDEKVDLNSSFNYNSSNVVEANTIDATEWEITGADAAWYELPQFTSLHGHIVPREITINGIIANNKAYDGDTQASLNFNSAHINSLIGNETLTISATGQFNDKNVGKGKTVTLSNITLNNGSDSGVASNYVLAATGNQASTTADITAKEVTVQNITAKNKEYDGNQQAQLTYDQVQIAPQVGNETLTVNANGQFNDKNVGLSKTITLSAITLSNGSNGGEASNYVLATTGNQTSTTADITAKEVTVQNIIASNKEYDGNALATLKLDAAQIAPMVGDETLTVTADGTFDNKNAGQNKTVTLSSLTLSDGTNGGEATNYVLNTTGNQTHTTANITTKEVTVQNISANSKVYDGNAQATFNLDRVQIAPMVCNETLTVAVNGTFDNKNVGQNKEVTLSSLTLGDGINGGEASNYVLATTGNQSSTSAHILVKEVTVQNITANNKVYDGNTLATLNLSTARIAPTVGEETLTITANGTFDDKNVGENKTVTLSSLTLVNGTNGGEASNYMLRTLDSQANTTADITAKEVTVQNITANSKVYDGNTQATLNLGAAQITPMVGDETLTVMATGTFNNKNVGQNKTVTLSSFTLANGTNGGEVANYQIATSGNQANTTADITAKEVTVQNITAKSKVYDGNTQATLNLGAAQIAPIVGDETLTVTAEGTFDNKNVGQNKKVTLSSLALANGTNGGKATNYVLRTLDSQANTTADITAKEVTVQNITANNKVYDGNTEASLNLDAAQIAPTVGDETLTITANGTFDNKNAGQNKTVTLSSLALSNGAHGGEASNYVLATNGNQANTTADITVKEVTVQNISANSKVYDGNAQAKLNLDAAKITPMVGNETLTVTAQGSFDNKNVGQNKTITLSALTLANGTNGGEAANYRIAATGSQTNTQAHIIAKEVTVQNITANSKVYDGNTEASLNLGAARIAPIVGKETLTVTANGTFDDKNVGQNKTVTLSALTLANGTNGGEASNYMLVTTRSQANTTADITAKEVTVQNITANSKVYDGNALATLNFGTAEITPMVGNETLTVTAHGTFDNKNVGQNKTVTLSSFTLANGTNGGEAANYQVAATGNQAHTNANITAKEVTVQNITANSKVYDGNTLATLTFNAAEITPMVGDETLTVTANGTFDNKNVGQNKTVTLASFTLTNGTNGGEATNYQVAATGNQANSTANITAKEVTVQNITANSKVYDGNTEATLNLGAAHIVPTVGEETLTVTADGTFDNKNVGQNKTVTLTSFTLANGTNGGEARNYVLATTGNQANTTANITAQEVTVQNITANSKVYDGNAQAELNLDAAEITPMVGNETLTVTAQGSFDNKNVGQNKTVTLSALTLANGTNGGEAANYRIAATGSQSNTQAHIIAKEVTVQNIIANSKVYDGNTDAALNLSAAQIAPMVGDETLTVTADGTFDNKNVGQNKTVTLSALTLANGTNGGEASNYMLVTTSSQANTTANITAQEVTVQNITANSKVYDGNVLATLNFGTAQIAPTVGDETLTVTANGTFDNKNVGQNKTVTLSALALANGTNGGEASNYVLATNGNQATATAHVTAKPIQVTIDTQTDVTYGSTVAPTYSADMLCENDAWSGQLVIDGARSTSNHLVVGSHTILLGSVTVSDSNNGQNYAISYLPQSFHVLPRQLQANQTQVTAIKQYDQNNSATVISAGTIGQEVEGDQISLLAEANYEDALPGTDKVITVNYALTGVDSMNYLAPLSYVYTTQGIIEDFFTLPADNSGLIANESGYCAQDEQGSIEYNLATGTPTHYQLIFDNKALEQGFVNSGYKAIDNNEFITFAIPQNCHDGIYNAQIQFKNQLDTESPRYDIQFIIELSNAYIVKMWNDVLSIDNRENRFTAYQWYHNGSMIPGANLPYYCENGGLTGTYQVQVTTTDGHEILSCETNDYTSEKRYETYMIAYPNPTYGSTSVKMDYYPIGSTVTVIDINGTVVLSEPITTEQIELDLSELPQGVYTIKVNNRMVKVIRL